jgi:hypothetical protein
MPGPPQAGPPVPIANAKTTAVAGRFFLFGAEVTWIYAQRHGSRSGLADQRAG